jgi:16S rRNA (guanine527-N7)-methyltransferase
MKKDLGAIGLEFDDQFYERCDKYILLLQQWGKIHNLTASLNEYDIKSNMIDSLYPLKFLNDFESLVDVGTGAGFPGLILAIARPNASVSLVEPRAKRVAFLNFVKSALKLDNVEVIQDRVENLDHSRFDLITSRAVTNTSLLIELTSKMSDANTSYLFYKGSLCNEEIKEAQLENYEVFKVGEHRNYLYMKR